VDPTQNPTRTPEKTPKKTEVAIRLLSIQDYMLLPVGEVTAYPFDEV